MTKFIDIQAGIVAKLAKYAPEVDVNSSDIEEGFKRPCFYVEMLDADIDNLANNFDEKKIEFDILYFPKHQKKNQEDLLKMRDILTEAFSENREIQISDDLITESENVKVFEVDKVLHCTFNIFIAEQYNKVYEYNMEELEFKEGIDANK